MVSSTTPSARTHHHGSPTAKIPNLQVQCNAVSDASTNDPETCINAEALTISTKRWVDRIPWIKVPAAKFHIRIKRRLSAATKKSPWSRKAQKLTKLNEDEEEEESEEWRKLRQRLQARITQTRNEDCSRIYRLPPELMLCVTDYLTFADLFSFLICCRWFHALATNPLRKQQPTARDRQLLRLYLENDWRFYKNNNKLWCSYCREDHQMGWFRRAMLLHSVSDSQRACWGSEGVFQMCQHREMTFDQIGGFGVLGLKMFHEECDQCDAALERDVDDTVRSSRSVLLTADIKDSVTCERMRNALRANYRCICPHLSTHSPEVFERLLARVQMEHSSGGNTHTTSGIFYPANCKLAIAAKCWKPDCRTTFTVLRIGNGVKMSIVRDLGMMEIVSGPEARPWLNQIYLPKTGPVPDTGAGGEKLPEQGLPDEEPKEAKRARRYRWVAWARDMERQKVVAPAPLGEDD